VWLSGHGVVRSGILAHTLDGLRVERAVVQDFTDYGIAFMTFHPDEYVYAPARQPVLRDIRIDGVHRVPRGSSNGTAEAGLWDGNGCTCDRISVRDTGWSGIETVGNANGATYQDVSVDGADVAAIYLEHYTRDAVFRRFHLGPDQDHGIAAEWADPRYRGTNPVAGQGFGGAHGVRFEDGWVETRQRGANLEDAEDVSFSGVVFAGQAEAAIRELRSDGSPPSTQWQDAGNDFTLLPQPARSYLLAPS
jgi:hypothetical protein